RRRREVAEPERLGRTGGSGGEQEPEQRGAQAGEAGAPRGHPVPSRSSSAALRPRSQRGSSESATSSTPASASRSSMRRASQAPATTAPAAAVKASVPGTMQRNEVSA